MLTCSNKKPQDIKPFKIDVKMSNQQSKGLRSSHKKLKLKQDSNIYKMKNS